MGVSVADRLAGQLEPTSSVAAPGEHGVAPARRKPALFVDRPREARDERPFERNARPDPDAYRPAAQRGHSELRARRAAPP